MAFSFERTGGEQGGAYPGPGPGESSPPWSAPRFFLRRLPVILVPFVVIPAAVLLFSLQQEKEYEAETSLLFRDTGDVLASEEPERETATNVRLLQLPGVENRVQRRLRSPFRGEVDVVAEEESNIATIIVTGDDPDQAARVANAYATTYIELRERNLSRERAAEREVVREALSEIPGGARTQLDRQTLQTRLRELDLAAVAPSAVTQVNRAQPPATASSPKPIQNSLVGAILGLALGIVMAIVFERRDRRVHDPRYIERVLRAPIIGRIPRSRALRKSGRGTEPLPPAEAEAFRTVRANLHSQLKAHGARSLLVTSAIPREGKTTLVLNIARMDAASGSRVLVVEADMRRPRLSGWLGANGAAGLSELLSGEMRLQDVVTPIDFAGFNGENGGQPSATVDMLFAGRPPTNPAELLDSDRMRAVLEIVPESYDLVLFDTPPAVVSDAMPMIEHVDGVLVVGRLGLSTDESLLELRKRLDQLDAPLVGIIINADPGTVDPYGYYITGSPPSTS